MTFAFCHTSQPTSQRANKNKQCNSQVLQSSTRILQKILPLKKSFFKKLN